MDTWERFRPLIQIYHDFRRRQQEFIDQSTYNVMIDLRKLFDPELGVFESTLKTDQIVHSLWGNLYSCPEHRGHYYEELNFRFRIPDSLIMTRGIYRLLKTEYNHLSDTSNSFYQPGVHSFLRESVDMDIKKDDQEDLGLGEELCEKGGEGQDDRSTGKKEDWGLVTSEVERGKKRVESQMENGEPRASSLKLGEMNEGLSIPVVSATTTAAMTVTTTTEVEGKVKASRTSTDEREMVHDDGDGDGGREAEVGGETNEDIKGLESMSGLGRGLDGENRQELESENQNTNKNDEEERSSEEKEQEQKTTEEAEMKKEDKHEERKDSSKKGKKGKSGTKETERPKTEAELAKERERKEKAEFLPPQVHPNELNLRNYVIQAGVFNFKLLEIPSQPKERGLDWTLHLIERDSGGLREIPFVADYIPPAVTDLHEVKKTPEEMEKEAKRQEEELQKLVQLEIKVPKIALWFEPPTPVRWDPGLKIWSTDGFYDVRFNEDSLQMGFRTTKFGVLGLAHNRWSNLPYQSWELRPNGVNKATLSLMAAMAVIEFSVENDLICVSSLQNVSNSDVIEAAIVGKFMKHRQLVKALRYHGLDVFPELDSYAYVDGILLKHTATENHLYQCMAVGASAFNFHWSRWNMLAGREKMVYQLRERHGTATPGNYQMVLNTPRGASLINCTEVSPNYSEETMEDYEYRADLLQVLQTISTPEAREKIEQASGHFVETIRLLLTSVRPLTFS